MSATPPDTAYSRDWKEAVLSFFHPRVVTMFFFGFSAGLPLLLIFSSLSLWLREAGVQRSDVTFFSWAALGYSFKFVWAPLVDRLPLFYLSEKFGRRRGWILLSQFLIIAAILWIGLTDPNQGKIHVYLMALAAVLLGFSSATQDIVIDAYRIESAGSELQAMMASAYIAGYRIGMLAAGAGALYIADVLGSGMGHYDYNAWKLTYFIMASLMMIGVLTTLSVPEPESRTDNKNYQYASKDYLCSFSLFILAASVFVACFFLTADTAAFYKDSLEGLFSNPFLAGFLTELARFIVALSSALLTAYLLGMTGIVNREMIDDTYIAPVKDFFQRYGALLAVLLLFLVGLYRISDIVLGVISNLFYQDLGFTKSEIASIVKTYGLFMTIAGGFIGGIFSARYGVIRILFAGALLACATNLLFMILAKAGHNVFMLYVVISADNLAAGLSCAAFVAFLSSLTSIRFTAVQYAIFSSLMMLIPKIFGGYSGTIVDNLSYEAFFLITALLGLPVLVLVRLAGKYIENG
ncbi:MAG: MFS transporter [Desulfobacterales bacterium]|nr:MFS transporter [Desulfobacterales bacterium]